MSYETLNKALGIIAELEAALAEEKERLRKVLVICDHWVADGCDCDACNELRDAIENARLKP